jgi:nitroreductase
MTSHGRTTRSPLLLALLTLLALAPACRRGGDSAPPAPAPPPAAAPPPATSAAPTAMPADPAAPPADLAFDPAHPIALPPPDLADPAPLMAALRDRQSSRTFRELQLSLPLLSNLLWAATGVNRPDSGKRTAPTARNRQDLDVYVATAQGLFLYLPEPHQLQPVLQADLRTQTGKQPFVGQAPLELVFVSDLTKLDAPEREDGLVWAGSHAGFVSQNVYLYCAAHGLATVVRAWFDKAELAAAMGLRPDQLVVLAQSVGYATEAGGDGE